MSAYANFNNNPKQKEKTMSDRFLHGIEIVELDGGAHPVSTVASSVIGLVGTAPKGPVNKPTVITGNLIEAIDTFGDETDGFTIPTALKGILDQTGAVVVVVNVADPDNEDHLDEDDELDPTAITATDIIGGVESDGTYTGIQCLLAAQTECKVQPRILIAPGFTHEPGTNNSANPVVTALLEVADRLRAMVVADCPNGTREQATTYQAEFTSARLYSVYPWAKVQKGENVVEEPLSPRVAGLIAKSDNDRGFWWSPSNQEIKGIIGLSKPVDFTLGDSQCVANYLNEHKVATVIQQDGYRLWGNRTASSDTKWQFLSVRRTADMINDSLLAAQLWAIDRNINRTYTEDVCESVNNYLRYLKNIGAIINGTCWADKNLNTPENIQLGNITFDFDFTPSFPAEHITFRSRLTNDYLEEIFE